MTVARNASLSLVRATAIIADVERQLAINTLRTPITDLPADDHWTLEAKAVLRDQIDTHVHRLAAARATNDDQPELPDHAREMSRYRQLLDHIGQETSAKLTQITVIIHALGQLT